MKITSVLAAAAFVALGFTTSAQAAVTFTWSAGATCGNAPAASFMPGGAPFQASLCASTTATTDLGCGFSAVFMAATAAESNAFSVTGRTIGTNYPDAHIGAPAFPLLVANPVADAPVDLGATSNTAVAPGLNQLLATFTFQPQASATKSSYVIGLSAASEFSVDPTATAGGPCLSAMGANTPLPSLTLSASTASGPATTISSAASATFTVATAGSFQTSATGTPTPTFSATGALPAGVAAMTSAGVLTGTPASGTAGTYPLVITASNGTLPNATQNFSLVIAKRTQTISFGAIAGQAFNASPFTIAGATASSNLAIAFTSSTSSVCSVTNAGVVTFITGGTCTITASQAGNVDFLGATTVSQSFAITPKAGPISLSSSTSAAPFGAPVTLSASVTGSGQTGTVSFSVDNGGQLLLTGCGAVPLVAGTANCIAPGHLQSQNPRQYFATYSGDATNAPATTSLAQAVAVNAAVVSLAAYPLPPIATGHTTTLTALVKMSSPAGTVTFLDNGVPLAGCTQIALAMLPDAIDSAVANCPVTAPAAASGIAPYTATYFYPQGHLSGKTSEQAAFDLRVVAQGPADFTDMWWAGGTENGWGMSITQHGPIQFNVIFAYDGTGKSLWYVMPGGKFNAAGTVFTGELYLPTSAPFSNYDKTKFVIGAPVGSATITYTSGSTATLALTIDGVSVTKSVQRQVFAAETSGPNLRINDLWWATFAEDGWGMNIAQQGRVLFPVWYAYDAGGKATFFTAQGGNWNGTVWSASVYAHSSSAWLGVAYNGSQFTATNVGTIALDFSDASNATMTTTVNGIAQVRRIERQPY